MVHSDHNLTEPYGGNLKVLLVEVLQRCLMFSWTLIGSVCVSSELRRFPVPP
jgi:hypothetical protein